MSVENDIREAFRVRAASVRPSKRAWSMIVRRLDVEAAPTREVEAVASVRPKDVIHRPLTPKSAEPEPPPSGKGIAGSRGGGGRIGADRERRTDQGASHW